MPGYLSDLGEERPEVEKELQQRCLYEGTIHEDGNILGWLLMKSAKCATASTIFFPGLLN